MQIQKLVVCGKIITLIEGIIGSPLRRIQRDIVPGPQQISSFHNPVPCIGSHAKRTFAKRIVGTGETVCQHGIVVRVEEIKFTGGALSNIQRIQNRHPAEFLQN